MKEWTLDALRWRVALATGVFAIMPMMLLFMWWSGVGDTGLGTRSRFSGPVIPVLFALPFLVTGAGFGVATYFTKHPAKTTLRAKIAGGLTLTGLLVLCAGAKFVTRGQA